MLRIPRFWGISEKLLSVLQILQLEIINRALSTRLTSIVIDASAYNRHQLVIGWRSFLKGLDKLLKTCGFKSSRQLWWLHWEKLSSLYSISNVSLSLGCEWSWPLQAIANQFYVRRIHLGKCRWMMPSLLWGYLALRKSQFNYQRPFVLIIYADTKVFVLKCGPFPIGASHTSVQNW